MDLEDEVARPVDQGRRVRWSRVRHGAGAVGVEINPDGATVIVQYRPKNGPVRREVIDAFTGQLRYAADRKLWTYRIPRGCWVERSDARPLGVPTGLLMLVVCRMAEANFQYVMDRSGWPLARSPTRSSA